MSFNFSTSKESKVFSVVLSNQNMSVHNNAHVFPMSEPQHFSDYGFDTKIDYFQVLEEAVRYTARSMDSIHFKLQKPIFKDESRRSQKTKRKRWWKNAFLFFKWRWTQHRSHEHGNDHHVDFHRARAREFRASVSEPLYLIESRSNGSSSTPHRTTGRTYSGPLAGLFTPIRKGEMDTPYLSLKEITMEQQQKMSSPIPIYLVT